MGEKRNACRILVGKPEGRRSLGRHRCRWEDNIKMDLREIGWGSMDWICQDENRDQWKALVNTIMNVWVPKNIGKFLSTWVSGGFLRRVCLIVVLVNNTNILLDKREMKS
jgi:hypothetical protein